MSKKDEVYAKYEDTSGDTYYCPVQDVADEHRVSGDEMDNCVETSTVGRYASNIRIVR